MAVIYQTDAEITSWAGINQSSDGYNMSMRYAKEAYNADVKGGSLKPCRTGVAIPQEIEGAPIETLARLHRRYHAIETQKDLLVAIAGGTVYTKVLDGEDTWQERLGGLANSDCDWVTYEVNREGSDAPTDVLLFTNADDGMYCLYGDTMQVEPMQKTEASPKGVPCKFGCIARYNERIWGGGIKDDPDKLVYSRAFDPFDWTQNNDIPEDGAGEVLQPSWDGDSFVALRPYGSQLLAIKKNAVWRVYGTNPGEFTMKEQYGGGAIEENTIAVSGSSVLMLGFGGIMRYDGADTSPYLQEAVQDIMKQVKPANKHMAYAVMNGKNYLLALPMGDTATNNAILKYNITDQQFTLMKDVDVASFLAFDDRVFYTSATAPGKVFELGNGDVLPLTYVTGYQDMGAKSSVKSAFTLYFRVEADEPVDITFGIETEKKRKNKTVTIKPGKAHRIQINVSGRFFRLIVHSEATTPWELMGGMQIHMELDPD